MQWSDKCLKWVFAYVLYLSGWKKSNFVHVWLPACLKKYFYFSKNLFICSPPMVYTYSGWKRSKFVYFGHVWPYLQWSTKSLNFNVQMFQEFVHYSCVVFLHVVYHTYSGQKRSKFVYFLTCLTIPAVVWKSLNFDGLFASGLMYLQWSEKV